MKNESSKKAATAKESVYEERVNGERREIVVDTIGYTGWKLSLIHIYEGSRNFSNIFFGFKICFFTQGKGLNKRVRYTKGSTSMCS